MKKVMIVLLLVLTMGCSYQDGKDYLSYEQYKTMENRFEGLIVDYHDIMKELQSYGVNEHNYFRFMEGEYSKIYSISWDDEWIGKYSVSIHVYTDKHGIFKSISYSRRIR